MARVWPVDVSTDVRGPRLMSGQEHFKLEDRAAGISAAPAARLLNGISVAARGGARANREPGTEPASFAAKEYQRFAQRSKAVRDANPLTASLGINPLRE